VIIFNAVIEHTLARFFGKQIGDRGDFYDADVFRSGNPADLATVIREVANTLEFRVAGMKFQNTGRGSAKVHLDCGIDQLRDLADQVAKRKRSERENYYWEIFGALMMVIIGLLETLEEQAVSH